MSMYTKQILELIVQRPGIRTVEIADLIDCDVDMVQPAIQDEIDAGRIVVNEVTAPNGRPANAFVPSPDLVAQHKPQTGEEVQPQSMAQPEPPIVTKQSKTAAAEIYLAKHGTATVEKMREVLNCDAKSHPNAHLATAIGKGRIVWVSGIYRLGTIEERIAARDRVGAAASRAATVVPVEAADQVFSVEPDNIPEFLKAPANEIEQPSAHAIEYAPSVTRIKTVSQEDVDFGLFTDGRLHIERKGALVDVLTPDEVRKLRRYLDRTEMVTA